MGSTLVYNICRVDHSNGCIKFEFSDIKSLYKTILIEETVCQPIIIIVSDFDQIFRNNKSYNIIQ